MLEVLGEASASGERETACEHKRRRQRRDAAAPCPVLP